MLALLFFFPPENFILSDHIGISFLKVMYFYCFKKDVRKVAHQMILKYFSKFLLKCQ